MVDYALSIPRMAAELVRLSRHAYLARGIAAATPPDGRRASRGKTSEPATRGARALRAGKPAGVTETLLKIMDMVRTVVGVDFREYKIPTFERRLARRMALRRVEGQEGYLRLLQRDEGEVRALCEDTLIHVSSFFRARTLSSP